MNRKVCTSLVLGITLIGCATVVEMPDLPASHPAHPGAESGVMASPSALLQLELPPPDTDPLDEPAQHDHMQQRGHGDMDMSGGMEMNKDTSGDMSGMDHGSMDMGAMDDGSTTKPGMGEMKSEEGSGSKMDMGEGSGSKMEGMSPGMHDKKDLPHNHAEETSESQTGPMNGRAQPGRIYRCPEHLGEQSLYSGNCMRCNAEMEMSETPDHDMKSMPPDEPTSAYKCTMHPELAFEGPGLCPKCGMTLIPRKEGGK